MEIGFAILQQMVKFFIMMLMGYLLVKSKMVKSDDSRVLSALCIYLVMPCVIINSFQVAYSEETLQGLLLAVGMAIVLHILMILVTLILGKPLHLENVERASIIFSNCGNLIIPVVMAVLGPQWVIYSSGYVCVATFFIWTYAVALLDHESGFQLKKILLNVNVISIVIGIILFLGKISLPSLVSDTLDSVGSLLAPVSMFTIGMMIAGSNLKQSFLSPRVYLIAALRLIFCPLVNLALIRLSGLCNLLPEAPTILFISFFATVSPPAVTITQLAQLGRDNAQYCSEINVVSTVLALLTIPLMTSLYWLVIG